MSKVVKNVLLVTGMSGAGKSVALNCLEDIGYYCIDNMPPVLLKHLNSLNSEANLNYTNIENLAIVIDGRSQDFIGILQAIEEIKNNNEFNCNVLFLDANEEVLTKRYKETRRLHPLFQEGSIIKGINFERKSLKNIREIADYVIDTSYISSNQLKREIAKRFEYKRNNFDINIMSFGFKHGTPLDCDFIFDVRFLPNPFYLEEMRSLTGLDEEVANYVMNRKDTEIFVAKVCDLLTFVLPKFSAINKNQVIIGIGCSGGQHRSVAISVRLASILSEKFQCNVWHRDIEKGVKK